MPSNDVSNHVTQPSLNQVTGAVTGGAYVYPYANQYYPVPVSTFEGYSNEVEVSTDEHDVTLRFFRTNIKSANKTVVATVIVPKSLYKKIFKGVDYED